MNFLHYHPLHTADRYALKTAGEFVKPLLLFARCRLCDAMGGAERAAIPWGNHSLSNRVEETVRTMISFIKKGGPKGWDDPWG